MARYYAKKDRHYGNHTHGKEFMDFSGNEYAGPYHYFGNYELVMTGAYPNDDSIVLRKYQAPTTTRDIIVYDLLTTQNLYEFKSPIYKTPGPGPNDLANGYMMRYFIKQKNDLDKPVIEIDKKQYKDVKSKDGKNINGFIYDKISIRWKIAGPRYDIYHDKEKTRIKSYGIESTNRRTAFAQNMKMPGLSDALRDLTQHSPYNKIRGDGPAGQQQDNLHTDGSEFVLPDGTPYIGYYHIHSQMGPMRGKKHSNKVAHDKLMTPGQHAMQQARSKDSAGGGQSSGY